MLTFERQDLTVTLMKALQHGHKLEAIKALREITGLGLKEAKDQVEFTIAGIETRSKTSPGPGRYVIVRPGDEIYGSYGLAVDEARERITSEDWYVARLTTRFKVIEEQL